MTEPLTVTPTHPAQPRGDAPRLHPRRRLYRPLAIAIGDATQDRCQRLVEGAAEFDGLTSLFDGSALLVKGEPLQLIREELRPESEATSSVDDEETADSAEPQPGRPWTGRCRIASGAS